MLRKISKNGLCVGGAMPFIVQVLLPSMGLFNQLNLAELKRELTKLKNRLMMEASAKYLGIEFK